MPHSSDLCAARPAATRCWSLRSRSVSRSGFAIYLINRSAADEVSLAARSLYGLADLAIESAAGLDENLYPRIAAVPGVAVASPVVEVEGKLADRRGSLTLLGVDAFRSRQLQSSLAALAGTMSSSAAAFDPQSVFLSASAARELKRDTGDVLEIQVGEQTQQLRVAGVLPQAGLEDRAGVMDIAAAQWKFGRLGKLSRINVRLASGARAERVRADIAALLPPDARVTTPGEASNEALRLSRAYRSNLTALALVALFTGGFFVYSTQSLATLRRRREFAVLHALGVTRAQQLDLCSRAARSSARAARCSAWCSGSSRRASDSTRSAAISAPATFAGLRPSSKCVAGKSLRSAC